jgi:D-alanyl-D-alanine carboxypeptidase (penicillin-binding protein 5/6)
MTGQLVTAIALSGILASQAANESQTVLFDLGSSRHATRGLVNNVTTPGELGLLLTGAHDTDGELTTVGFRQLDGWCAINVKGHQGEGSYPSSAMRDSFALGEGDDRTARIQIEGLTAADEHTFTFFASRMDVSGELKRISAYTIGDRTVRLDAANNTETRVSIADVPADARGAVTIEIACPEGSDFAYLGVLQIEGKFPKGRWTRQPPDPLDGPPPVSAKAWAIADGKTGEVLWGLHEDQPRKIASTTKMMCAWVALQLATEDPAVFDEVVTFSKLADETGGSTSGVREGESVPVGELLYGLLLPSGNDAGNALAEHFNDRLDPPRDAELRDDPNLATRASFVAEMNRTARRLGMTNTKYRSPYGDGGTASQFTSTPRDLLRLAWTAMQEPRFRKYVGTPRYRCVLKGADGAERVVVWKNTNQLLKIEGFDGVKTGTTSQAGACLVSSGRRGSDHLLVVVLGSAADACRYLDTRNLFRWAWRERGHRAE